jgi:epoxyqueuosine reductase
MQQLKNVLNQSGIFDFSVCKFSNDLLIGKYRAAPLHPPWPQKAKSLVVCAFPYYIGRMEQRNLSLYAVIPDYHKVLMKRLTQAASRLSCAFGGGTFVPFADSSPLDEVKAAERARLGAVGKNGLLITPKYGSFVFLGAIVTDAPLPKTPPLGFSPLCSNCSLCINLCPTGALGALGLDAQKCRSAITQKRGELTIFEKEQIRQGALAWGCDICTLACPHNTDIPITYIAEFLEDTAPVITPQNLQKLAETRAFTRAARAVLARNLKILSQREGSDD